MIIIMILHFETFSKIFCGVILEKFDALILSIIISSIVFEYSGVTIGADFEALK